MQKGTFRTLAGAAVAAAVLAGSPDHRRFHQVTLPRLMTDLRTAAAFCVVGVVVGEFVADSAGPGHLAKKAQSLQPTARSFAAIAYWTVMAQVYFHALVLPENRLVRR